MTLDEIKTALSKLPIQDLQKIRGRLDDLIESQLEPSDECKTMVHRPNKKSPKA